MNTYTFQVVVEPDEDGWHVYYPAWTDIGASTWGYTHEEALKNIQEVLSMIIEEFLEEGKPVPVEETMNPTEGASVAVTV